MCLTMKYMGIWRRHGTEKKPERPLKKSVCPNGLSVKIVKE